MATKAYPHIPKDLLEYLELLYPDKSQAWDCTNESKCFMEGQISVVRNIRFNLNKQLNNQLENKPHVHA